MNRFPRSQDIAEHIANGLRVQRTNVLLVEATEEDGGVGISAVERFEGVAVERLVMWGAEEVVGIEGA